MPWSSVIAPGRDELHRDHVLVVVELVPGAVVVERASA
jgi:hypothetical protein